MDGLTSSVIKGAAVFLNTLLCINIFVNEINAVVEYFNSFVLSFLSLCPVVKCNETSIINVYMEIVT